MPPLTSVPPDSRRRFAVLRKRAIGADDLETVEALDRSRRELDELLAAHFADPDA